MRFAEARPIASGSRVTRKLTRTWKFCSAELFVSKFFPVRIRGNLPVPLYNCSLRFSTPHSSCSSSLHHAPNKFQETHAHLCPARRSRVHRGMRNRWFVEDWRRIKSRCHCKRFANRAECAHRRESAIHSHGERLVKSNSELVRQQRRWWERDSRNHQRGWHVSIACECAESCERYCLGRHSRRSQRASKCNDCDRESSSRAYGCKPDFFCDRLVHAFDYRLRLCERRADSFFWTSLATTFVSATHLTAGGTASTAGTFGVAVSNPNPGGSTSGSINVQVTNGSNPPPPPPPCSAMATGQGASLNGFLPFPTDNPWNQNIASAPVDPNSANIINFIGSSIGIHPDFGSGLYNGSSIGIPYVIVGSAQPFVDVNFTAYGDESDPGPMPVPAMLRLRAIRIPAAAIATCSFSTITIAGSTSFTIPPPELELHGMPIAPLCGIY